MVGDLVRYDLVRKGESVAFFECFYDLWTGPPRPPKFPTTAVVLLLQVDLEQQFGHLLQAGQNSTDRNMKHLSNILITDNEPSRDLCLSFAAALLQYMHELQPFSLH